ncbi:hypothetical protein CEXT_789971 [Caerostris extrusa]|uniref:Uncharacterized protein n=1 Tax=Caerostris extrusa TaxID=172846 RepID=A0AAV4M456_CAEEX|nr:hypothetical protein CEXT_789971 [Caerostris extrusa]
MPSPFENGILPQDLTQKHQLLPVNFIDQSQRHLIINDHQKIMKYYEERNFDNLAALGVTFVLMSRRHMLLSNSPANLQCHFEARRKLVLSSKMPEAPFENGIRFWGKFPKYG